MKKFILVFSLFGAVLFANPYVYRVVSFIEVGKDANNNPVYQDYYDYLGDYRAENIAVAVPKEYDWDHINGGSPDYIEVRTILYTETEYVHSGVSFSFIDVILPFNNTSKFCCIYLGKKSV